MVNQEKRRAYIRRWRAENPDKIEKYRQTDSKNNPNRYREYARRYRKSHPNEWKTYHLKSKYGITLEEKDAMIAAQNNLCAICQVELLDPHVDHQEEPFKVRGILCHNCNVSLGLMKDSSKILRAAAEYLERFGR